MVSSKFLNQIDRDRTCTLLIDPTPLSSLMFNAVDDVVHVPARRLLLEVGDHGVDILVVTVSPPESEQQNCEKRTQLNEACLRNLKNPELCKL